jgi:molybdate transport system substrate-binding protein
VRAGVLLGVIAVLTGCTAPAAPTSAEAAPEDEVTVYAAASLRLVFDDIAARFEAAHPGVDVRVVYDGSSVLVTQIAEGAAADVIATADEESLERISDRVSAPVVFAGNTLVIAVAPGNPAGVRTIEDLADAQTVVVLCAEEVPCGATAQALLAAAGVVVRADSYEQSVSGVVVKVASGEADAGLVYTTDAAAESLESFTPPDAEQFVARYPIATVDDAPHPEAAALFAEFVLGDDAQSLLAAAGFRAP